MKKLISILLLVFMLVSMLVACGNGGKDTTPAGSVGSDSGDELPNIPDGVAFDGETITILTTGTLGYSDFNKEINNTSYDTVNQAILERNGYIEDKYGIEIETVEEFKSSFGNGPGYTRISKDNQSQSCEYDICSVGTYDAAQLALAKYITDLNATKYIDLDRSWWDQKANEDLEMNGVMYFTTGDISFVNNICTHMIMFNKQLMSELELKSPYELIKADEWYFDTFLDYAKKASSNLDGNDSYDKNDRYGVLTWNDVIHQALHSSRQRVATINEDGKMELTVYNDTTVNLMKAYTDVFYDEQNCFNYSIHIGKSDWDATRQEMFDNGRALFYTTLFTTVPKHRDSDTVFGIIPYPKFTENQDDYGHYISATHSQMLCLEAVLEEDEERLDMISMLVEDMAYKSKHTIRPAYYDDTLIGKNVRDDESIEMLDIIFASRVFDVGIYYKVGGNQTIAANLTALLTSGQNDFSSRYSSFETPAKNMINEINDQFAKVK